MSFITTLKTIDQVIHFSSKLELIHLSREQYLPRKSACFTSLPDFYNRNRSHCVTYSSSSPQYMSDENGGFIPKIYNICNAARVKVRSEKLCKLTASGKGEPSFIEKRSLC